MNICYILYSPKLNRFYTGATHEGIEQRLLSHNSQKYGANRFTATSIDWEVFLIMECLDYTQAIRIERHIKKMKSSAYIRNLKNYPELVQKLLDKM
jgi:putative endonuclease